MNEITTVPPRQRAGVSPFAWLRHEVDRLFEDVGGAGWPGQRLFGTDGSIMPPPAVEIVENGKDYRLTAELPGVDPKQLRLEVDGDDLVIAGEKHQQEDMRENGFLLTERRYGSFERRIAMPPAADLDHIEATYRDGVLSLTVPKLESAAVAPRRIEIGQG